MAGLKLPILLLLAVVLLYATPAHAFGAGNIASLSKIEGHNWRHGDIEDMLRTVAFIRGHKWSSMMIKRVYFGNWLRDYSQAVDVGTLKGVQSGTIRVLVWILGFMSFGYATQEFEVTEERLGVYRPEEHIDNPKDYADNEDARKYDPRLRPPVQDIELAIDPNTGMKNYIGNEAGGWATSSGYVKHSLARSIHFGRMYTSSQNRGRTEDLCEALRCLGQALHTLEDFGAHSNYTELALLEMGYNNVFPHVGTATRINVRGKSVWPLVTGTFGGVDFLHSVIGEATDHVTQSELDEMDNALGQASSSSSGTGTKSHGGPGGGNQLGLLGDLLSNVPGTSHLMEEARRLQAASNAQAQANAAGGYRGFDDNSYSASRADPPTQPPSFQGPPGSTGGPPGPGIPGLDPNMDPQAVVAKIYPILVFRDNVVRTISGVVSKIPGLEKLIDTITERVTLFVFGLLAPYLKPLIAAASKQLKSGSSAVVDSSAHHQFEVWDNPHSSDPTHSLLSKDHFSNYLNPPAGQVATAILQYTAPRVFYAWDHPDVPVDQVLNDVIRAFHHPALRDQHLELHRSMFHAVEKWVREVPDKNKLNQLLSSESVKAGKNHKGDPSHAHPGGGGGGHGGHSGAHSHGGGFTTIPGLQAGIPGFPSGLPSIPGFGSHSKVSGSPFEMFNRRRDLGEFGEEPGPYGGSSAQEWQPQGQYTSGEVVSYKGASYKCIQTHHVDAPNWTPDVPSLWTRVDSSAGSGLQEPAPQRTSWNASAQASPQPPSSPWQPGGYENQTFGQVSYGSHSLGDDHGAYEMPSSYHQGYHDGAGYGGGGGAQQNYYGQEAQGPYAQAGGSSSGGDPYGYGGDQYQQHQAGGSGGYQGGYNQPPPGPYGQY